MRLAANQRDQTIVDRYCFFEVAGFEQYAGLFTEGLRYPLARERRGALLELTDKAVAFTRSIREAAEGPQEHYSCKSRIDE